MGIPGRVTTAVNPEVTISVDGVSLAPFTFRTTIPFGGVTHVSRSGSVTTVACVKTRARSALTTWRSTPIRQGFTEVFSDDFESYLEGDSLDTDNASFAVCTRIRLKPPWRPFPVRADPGSPGNQLAEIIDTDPG